MEDANIAVRAASGYSSEAVKIGFATPEGLLPFSTFALLSNKGEVTMRQRDILHSHSVGLGFSGKLGETLNLTYGELEKLPDVEGYLFTQHMFDRGNFIIVGLGDEAIGEPALEIAAEAAIDALAKGVKDGSIVWHPDGTLYARLVLEHRNEFYDWEPGVMDRIRAVRKMQAVRSLTRGLVKGAGKHSGAQCTFQFKADAKPEGLRFEIAFGGIGFHPHEEMLEREIFPAAMKELYLAA